MIKTTQTWEIGDCLELMREYPDNHFNLVLTDPPYGIGESNEKNATRGHLAEVTDFGHYEWDNKRIDKEYFDEMQRISKNQIIFGGNYYTDYLKPSSCWIVWDKDNGDNDFADCELAWASFKTAVRMIKYRWNGMLQGDMKHKEKRVHPTQKPVPLFTWILEKYSNEGDLICDPFLGSGTSLAACRKTNRNCIGFEISDKWEHLYADRCLKHTPTLQSFFGEEDTT
jgi:site-specific DNA-methyltransferase (adenine-specific)